MMIVMKTPMMAEEMTTRPAPFLPVSLAGMRGR